MAQRGGYQLPENLHPEGRLCVQFEIPDDLFYIANFWGAIGELAKWTSYQRTGDDSGVQAANVMAEVIDSARESFLSGCNGDAPPSPEIIEVVKYILLDNSEDEENEECSDMCKCPNSVHYDTETQRLYYLDSSCNRIPISPSPLPDALGFDGWTGLGELPITGYPDIKHDDPLYKTSESLKCAKATALVNEMWNVIGVYQGFNEVEGFLGLVALVTGALGFFMPAVAAELAAGSIATALTDLAAEIGLSELEDKLQAVYENEAIKAELICDLVNRMSVHITAGTTGSGAPVPKTSVTDADIKIAMARFEDLVPNSDEARVILGVFPMRSWKEVVTPKITATECGCEDYAPVDPLEGAGMIVTYATNALNYSSHDPDPDSGSGYTPEDLVAIEAASGGDAVELAQDEWRSEVSFNGSNRGLGLIFKAPAGARITKATFDVYWEGTSSGVTIHVGIFRANTAGNWTLEARRDNAVPGEYPIMGAEFPGMAAARYFYITYHILGGDSTSNVRVDNMRFDVAADDGSWTRTNVMPEQNFPM